MANLLKQKILERIDNEGPINFETFMEMALYYPELGYYTKEHTKIGREGDFYTSPHLHPLFGAMLGKQMEEMWEILGYPDTFDVVEMGAGLGYLAKDMLEYLKRRSGSDLFDHIGYWILELNPSLKKRQQEILSEFSDRIKWIASMDDIEPITGTFLSNELLDSFPIRLIETSIDKAGEIYVSRNRDNLIEVIYPLSNEVKAYLEEFSIEIPPFYRTEVNLRIKDWIKSVSKKIKEGFIITIDYGYTKDDYYSEERNRGTLLCYYKHQVKENPYQNIGEQDITAHVNFSSLKKWAEERGLKTLGFCPQGTYLLSLGIDELINQSNYDFFEIAKIKGLLLPQGMGQSHHVMIHYKGKKRPDLKGFRLKNRLKYL
jgi:SAM-dependent MidA family methyltransferase